MPGIDFDRLRREIPMEDVQHLIAFQPCQSLVRQPATNGTAGVPCTVPRSTEPATSP